jgi:hypothetical protein
MKTTLCILFLGISLASFAQTRAEMRERIKTQKIAFITEKLSLTTSEAEKFWPVYNRFEATEYNIHHKDFRSVKHALRENPDMPEVEADKLLDLLILAEDKMYKAKVELMADLKGIISSKKIIKLKRAEDEFNRELLKKFKEMHEKKSDKRD